MPSSRRAAALRLQSAIESLESRRLLCSTHLAYLPPAPKWSDAIEQESRLKRAAEGGPEAIDIVWTNRNMASDNFGLAFGTSAEAGRQVVDAAIAAWERVITSFNRSDGTNTLQLTISIATDAMGNLVGGFGGAGGPAAAAPADGKPRTGSITLNAGTIVPNTPNDANGWFFDPTPNDYSEFNGGILNPFSGNPGSSVGGELYSVVAAELTHSLGFISPKAGGTGSNWVGYELIDSGFTQPTGQRDNSEGGGTSGYYYVFNGPSVSHAMTSFNGGDPDDDSWGNVIHTAGGTANFTHNAVNYRGTDDDGNAAGGGERTLPSWVTANILKDAYGYTVENPAKFGTMLAILNQNTGALTVRGIDNSDDTIFITSNGVTTTVHVDLGTDFPGSGFRPGAGNLNAWVSEFPAGSIQSINVDAGGGDDVVNLDLPGNIPITVSGGAGGNDLLLLKGSTGYDNFNVDFPLITGTALNVQSFGEFESLRIDTRTGDADLYLTDLLGSMTGVTVQGDSGNEVINLHTLEASKPAVFFMGSGNDTVNVQVDPGVGLVASPVTINGFDGDDTVRVGPVDFAGTIVTQPVTFNGDANNDTFILGSNNADSVRATMTFNGGTHSGGNNDRLVINDQAPAYGIDYDVRPTFVTRAGIGTYNVNYAATEEIFIHCGSGADDVIVRNGVAPIVQAFGNDGPDNFTRGDGIITASSVANFNGGAGIDQITFDDHLNVGNIIFDCREGEVFYGGLITQFTTGFESVGIRAGSGQNEITFAGTLSQNFDVDAGDGNDTIILGFTGTGPGNVTFNGNVTVTGGDGPDTFQVNGVNTSPGASVSLNGANSINHMVVNRPGTLVYDIGGGFFNMASFGSSASLAIANMETAAVQGNSLGETFNVFSASSLFGLYQIFGNNGDDRFNLFHSASGNHSFDNLQLNGGFGNDSLHYDASATTGGRTYVLENGFLSLPAGIIFDDIQIGNTVENTTITGGSGDDTFRLNQYSAGTAVHINAGDGNDVLHYGNDNFPANLTNMSAFTFDGQGGSDTFNADNRNAAGASFIYTRNLASVVVANFGGYSFTTTEANSEIVNLNAGGTPTIGDVFRVNQVRAGSEVNASDTTGVSSMQLGQSTNDLEAIRGRVVYAPSSDGGRVEVFDTADTTGDTFHLDQSTLGFYPGDDLFGPGGYLAFAGIIDLGAIAPAMTINLGSGSDTAFAQPLAGGTVVINYGAQNLSGGPEGVGDELNLALASAVNYVITDNGTGTGNVISDSTGELRWTGLDLPVNVDDVAPSVLTADFVIDGPVMSVAHTFSEALTFNFGLGFLYILNLDTNEPIPFANMAVDYDPGTFTVTHTFPGYANGVLPDGNYRMTLAPGFNDLFGNASGDVSEFDTFVFAGDANQDRTVGIADFAIVAANFNQPGVFTSGDFNYSGTVEIGDFAILAAKFNTTLDPPSLAAATAGVPRPALLPAPARFSSTRIADRAGANVTDPTFSGEDIRRLLRPYGP